MESPFKADVLKGKVALLTGGGTGIGFEMATQFGKHGAAVAIMGRRKNILDSAVSDLQSHGIRAIGIQGDVRNKEDAARVVDTTFEHFGSLDILVNNAAGNFLISPEDLSPNGFKTVMDIDTLGTFTMCHAAFKYLKKGAPGREPSQAGVILNVSVTYHYSAEWYQIHVSAAKAAIDSMTRSLALEWGTHFGIRVNAVAPGPVEGTIGMSKIAPKELNIYVNYVDKWDVAMAALYLTSEAGRNVNGAIVVVDKGRWLEYPPEIDKEEVRRISRAVEKRSRTALAGAPSSKM